ncbi:MAG: hypothetical protein MI724_04535, partial [Spirochaetales bacterium]|nr:hypothetical protein [Spirochaetales bacterium]
TGIGALIFEAVYLVATVILLSLYGGKIWDMARRHDLVSPMELFAVRYGRLSAQVGTVVASLALVPYTAVQVIGLAVILEGFGLAYGTGVLFAVANIGVWTLLGGLRGVAITDALQGFFMLAVAIVVLLWARSEYQAVELSSFPNAVWTPRFFINLTLPWSFFALTNPQVVQRLFMLRRRKDLRNMIILFALFGAIFTVIVTFVGFAAKAGTLQGLFPVVEDRDRVIVEIMAGMGRTLALPLALSIVFASVSTANSILLTLSSMFTRDILGKRDSTMPGRIVILVLTALIGLFAVRRPATVIELSVSSSRVLLVFLPLLFGVFHLKRTGRWSAIIPLVGGFAAVPVAERVVPSYSSLVSLGTATALFAVGLALDRFVLNGERPV